MEEARKKQAKSVDIINILIKHGGAIVTGKAIMKTMGVDCGNCRPPMRNLDEPQFKDLLKDLESVGFYE